MGRAKRPPHELTLDLSTRLCGITTEFVGFIPQSPVLRSNVLGWILMCRNCSIWVQYVGKVLGLAPTLILDKRFNCFFFTENPCHLCSFVNTSNEFPCVHIIKFKDKENTVEITEILAPGECPYSCLGFSQTFTIVSITLKNRRDHVSNFLQENYQSKAYLCFFLPSDLLLISFNSSLCFWRQTKWLIRSRRFPVKINAPDSPFCWSDLLTSTLKNT